jgi:hypothetical protein
MDPKKVKSIEEWPTPESVKDVQSFLGLAGYVRSYVEGYSNKTIPLTDMTKKDKPFS